MLEARCRSSLCRARLPGAGRHIRSRLRGFCQLGGSRHSQGSQHGRCEHYKPLFWDNALSDPCLNPPPRGWRRCEGCHGPCWRAVAPLGRRHTRRGPALTAALTGSAGAASARRHRPGGPSPPTDLPDAEQNGGKRGPGRRRSTRPARGRAAQWNEWAINNCQWGAGLRSI